MTSPDNSQIVSQYNSLKSRFDRLYGEATMSQISQDVSDSTREVSGLPGDIAKISESWICFRCLSGT